MSLWILRSVVVVKVGYARISTDDQKYFIIHEWKTRTQWSIRIHKRRNILVTWRLDWLGRSLKHLMEQINELDKREIGFESLQE